MRYRVIITGGREYRGAAQVEHDVDVNARLGCGRLVQGGAPGADTLARAAWRRWIEADPTLEEETYEPDASDGPWPEAGTRRNTRMLLAEVALITAAAEASAVGRHSSRERLLVWALPDPASSGTWHMVGAALTHGVPVMFLPAGPMVGARGARALAGSLQIPAGRGLPTPAFPDGPGRWLALPSWFGPRTVASWREFAADVAELDATLAP